MPRIGAGACQGSRARSCRAAPWPGRSTRPTIEWAASSCPPTPLVCATRRAPRDLPLAAILDAQEHTVDAALGKVGMMPFHPWIDGDLLDAPPFRAPLAALPLVVGTNANEMELFRDQVPALPEEVAVSFLAGKASSLGIADEARVRAGLRACDGDLVEAVADLDLHVPTELMARDTNSVDIRSGATDSIGRLRRAACATRSICRSPSAPSTSTAGATSPVPTTRRPTRCRNGCAARGRRSR